MDRAVTPALVTLGWVDFFLPSSRVDSSGEYDGGTGGKFGDDGTVWILNVERDVGFGGLSHTFRGNCPAWSASDDSLLKNRVRVFDFLNKSTSQPEWRLVKVHLLTVFDWAMTWDPLEHDHRPLEHDLRP